MPQTSTPSPYTTLSRSNDDTSLAISADQASKAEGNSGTTPFTFTITRAGGLTGTSSVNWAVQIGASMDTADFGGLSPSGTVTFAAGETSKTITVNVSGDTTVESDELLRVLLSNAV